MKELDKVDILKIKEELNPLLEKYKTTFCLQGISKDQDPFYGIGSAFDFTHGPSKDVKKGEELFSHFLFNLPYTNKLLKEYNMFRTRVMIQPSKTCYTYHKDFTPRNHIPVITNDDCLFILEDIVYRMKEGSIYFVDTVKKHTAVNCSKKTRIHIVGNI